MCDTNDRFIAEQFTPAYVAPSVRHGMGERVKRALESLSKCHVCPRHCGVNRLAGETKVCQTGRYARVSSAGAHFGEEGPLRGTHGSGTIFFARCNLHCVFCQNWEISQTDDGRECDAKQIAEQMLQLQQQGCHNINFVTPEHAVPQVVEAIAAAVDRGLRVPIVYNTSAYDSIQSLHHLDGLIDIYMPDFKLWSPGHCARYLGAKDYPEHACRAIMEMHRQVGDLRMTSDGIACRGLLVRHLVMPGLLDDSGAIFRWLAQQISCDTYINIMAQYHAAHLVGTPRAASAGVAQSRYGSIDRRPTPDEMAHAYELARAAGLWRFDEHVAW